MDKLLNEVEEVVQKTVKKEIETAVNGLRTELRQEMKNANNELGTQLRQEMKKANDELRTDLEGQIKAIGLKLEFDIERKIDIILDYITMQQEKDAEELHQIRQLEKRVEQNEIQILDHEKRIVVLEKRMLKN